MADIPTTPTKEIIEKPAHEFSPLEQWQIAFIYAFSATFNQHQDISPSYYKLPDFTPQDLQVEIQKDESELLHQIICACVGNILNRAKPVEAFKIALQHLVSEKMKVFEIDLESNPLLKQNFYTLSVDLKLYLLHSIIEWQLQDSTAVRTIIETFYQQNGQKDTNPIISHPVGIDSKKRTYWQFGDSPWVWRETHSPKSTFEWEIVCKNLQDLEQLVESFSGSTSKVEKALVKAIQGDVYEVATKEEQKRIRKERAELRKLIPIEVSITPTTLRSRGDRSQRVRYNYDDIYGTDNEEEADDDEFVDEDDGANSNNATPKRQRRERLPSPSRPPPTRWSSRLNRGAAEETEETEATPAAEDTEANPAESMDIDTQTVEAMDTIPLPSEQSNDNMDISRSPSFMDTTTATPIESPKEAISNSNVINVHDILNPQVVHE